MNFVGCQVTLVLLDSAKISGRIAKVDDAGQFLTLKHGNRLYQV